jgi:cholesterol transport system auxiliary component
MVQNLLLESLENAGKLDVLGREVVGIRADYALLTHIREFQAEYGETGPPRVQVRLQARLVRLPRRTSIGSTSEVFTVAAQDRSMAAIVVAFDEGLGKALRRVVEWAVREVARAQAAAAVSGG